MSSRGAGTRPGPVGGKRDENRKQRTKALRDAALKLFLARGIEAVSIDDIVGDADMAKGSFYRYFADKTALVAALMEPLSSRTRDAFARCEQALSTPGLRREDLMAPYQLLAEQLALAAFEDPDAARLYLQECRAPAEGARKPIAVLARELEAGAIRLAEVARNHKLTRDLDPRVSALMVVGAVEHFACRLLTGEFVGTLDDVAEALISIVLDGVRAR